MLVRDGECSAGAERGGASRYLLFLVGLKAKSYTHIVVSTKDGAKDGITSSV